ncbi:MAG: DUF1800 domain-containing protein [Phycisphaerales bacterium]|nr:DUF1800 domain-containing protein [Phycisphaerales bacterium]
MLHGRSRSAARAAHAWIITAALLLAGCGGDGLGGGLGGGSSAGNAQSVAKYQDNITADEAYHLLRRAAFGATPEQVQAAVERGLSATVDDLLTAKPEPATLAELEETYENDGRKRWLVELLESPNPLRERLTLFWHDRFATSRRVADGRDDGLALLHLDMLRRNALGNYRAFLEELTIDPLMLIWLNGAESPKDNPNENYAREFWELFTLGRDVLYTEQDIREAARAFTGITLLREREQNARPIYDLINHDETPKTIFPARAESANYNYLTVIDLTLEQPEAARYVARNLFACFVHDHPTDAVVDELARTFAENDFEIAPLVRQILTSQAMFSSEARGGHVLSPVEHVVGVARTLDMHMISEESQNGTLDRLARDLADAGQDLLNPPGVQGWTEGPAWLEDQWVISRVEALGRHMEFGPEHTEDLPYHLLPPRSTWDQREVRTRIVDAMAAVFHLELTDVEKDIFIEVLDQNGWRAFHLDEPDDQPRHVAEMIRLMCMHDGVLGS